MGVVPFPALRPYVDQEGTRVFIRGRRAKTFLTESNAARSAETLTLLASLGWPIHRMVEEK